MAYTEKAEVAAKDYTREIQYLSERIDRIHTIIREDKKMFRLFVRILVDKKVLSPELAKTFEETQSNEELIEWFLKDDEKETEEGK